MGEKREQSPFLLKLQHALKTGKANETTNIINNIDEHSKSLTAEDAQDRLTARIEQVGYAKGVSKEEMLESQKQYEAQMEQYKQEEAKFTHIAAIENAKSEINAIKIELADVVKEINKKYGEAIATQESELKELQETFIQKYGKEAFQTHFSG